MLVKRIRRSLGAEVTAMNSKHARQGGPRLHEVSDFWEDARIMMIPPEISWTTTSGTLDSNRWLAR